MDRIVADPAIMGGAVHPRHPAYPWPPSAGLLAENATVQEVLQHYPQLTAQDVRATAEPTRPGRDQR